MSSEPRTWMRPDDLVLYQLDQLPWPAYLCLLERYFEENAFRIKLIASEPSRAEFLLVSKTGVRQLLHCCSMPAVQRLDVLGRLCRSMTRFQVHAGILASPNDFPVGLAGSAREVGVELYSGNRLRAKIEMMKQESRRRVLDSIRPRWRAEQDSEEASWSDVGPTG